MIVFALLLASAAAAQPAVTVCEGVWTDATRRRTVPVRVRMPSGEGAVPTVLFSHGLGGSLDAGTDWAQAWAQGGIATVHLQHPGSDAATWQAATGRDGRIAALRAAASAEQAIARVRDVHFVLDELARRQGEVMLGGCKLARLDLERIGMAGHSFGAVTTQAVAGQRNAAGRSLADPRVRAAIAFSPSPAATIEDTAAFGAIAIPFLSVTGTADTTPLLARTTAADRLRPFAAMPAGDKYLLVFAGADHAIFNGHTLRRDPVPSDRHVRRVTADVTTQFWLAYLGQNSAAKSWLQALDLGQADPARNDRLLKK